MASVVCSAGVTPAQAEEAVRRLCTAINRNDPNPANARAAYMPPLHESFVMDLRPKILVIVGAALCALLIAATNFAGLLLGARDRTRRRVCVACCPGREPTTTR